MICLILLVVVLTLVDEGGGGPDSPGISRALRHYESLDALDD